MLEIPGLGPKKIKALHDELGIETVEQLEQACKDGKIAGLKGFGEKTRRTFSKASTAAAPMHRGISSARRSRG
jgi:DNA polymerase (family 10)